MTILNIGNPVFGAYSVSEREIKISLAEKVRSGMAEGATELITVLAMGYTDSYHQTRDVKERAVLKRRFDGLNNLRNYIEVQQNTQEAK